MDAFWENLVLSFSRTNLLLASWFSTGLVLGYYLYLYYRYRDSGERLVLPMEEAPRGLSPAAARYVLKGGYDTDCLIVGLLNAVTKNVYTIKWYEEAFGVYLANKQLFLLLSSDEQAALSFRNGQPLNRLGISQKRSQFSHRAGLRMTEQLAVDTRKYLLPRLLLWGGGILGGVVLLLLSFVLFSPAYTYYALGYLVLIFPALFVLPLIVYMLIEIRNWPPIPMAFVFLIVPLFGLWQIDANWVWNYVESDAPHYIFPFVWPLFLVAVVFYFLLPSYTDEGLAVCREIGAFREYLVLRIADSDAMEISGGDIIAGDEEEDEEGDSAYLVPYLIGLEVPCKASHYFASLLTTTSGNFSGLASPTSWGRAGTWRGGSGDPRRP